MSNTIPLVTTKLTPKSAVITLLTYPASRQHHTCSNFVMANSPTGQHSLLSLSPGHTESQANLLYQHYDPTQCMWTFKTWIPLGELESRCGAVSTATNISVHLYVLYTSIHNNTVGVVSTVSIDAVMDYTAVHTSNQAAAPPPYNYFPIHSGRKQVFVHPISIEWDSITNSLIAILYSYTPTSMMFHSGYLANRIKRRSISSDGIVLLYSHHSGKQAWLMQLGMDRNQSTNIDLQFSLVTCVKTSLRSRCRPGHPFTFHIPLILVLPNNSTQKNWSSLTRILTHTALTAHISRLDEQERVLGEHNSIKRGGAVFYLFFPLTLSCIYTHAHTHTHTHTHTYTHTPTPTQWT